MEKAGERQPQQIHGYLGDGVFRRKIFSVEVIDAAHSRIRSHKAIGELRDGQLHGRIIR